MNRIQMNLHLLLAAVLIGGLSLSRSSGAGTQSAVTGARKSPEWLRSAVVYEIYPRDFSQAGDFNSITARLDELKDLGVDILWLMPIHPIGEKLKKGSIGSPYCVRDYYAVNPDYGTTNDFKRLVDESHKRGMKLIMDIVAGHSAWDCVLMDRHSDFYQKDSSGKIVPPNTNWTDVAKFDYANASLRRYMIDMLGYWMKEFGVDGFRCDVAYTVPVDFWEAARTELEKINPHVIILAEVGAKPIFLSKAFDMDASWNLFYALDGVLKGVSPAYLIRQSWEVTQQQFPEGVLHLRFSDNHGQVRAVSRYGAKGALAAQALMLTLDGVPLFYNGMEVGDSTESNDPALFEKMPVFWHPDGRPPMREIYRDLIKLRKKSAAFYNGDVVWLQNSAPAEVASVLRRDAKDEYLVLVNFSSRGVDGSVDLPEGSGFEPVKISGMPEPVGTVIPDFHLTGFGWTIFHRAAPK